MCTALISIKQKPNLSIIILHNRDEMLDRDSLPMAWREGFLHGLDVQSGGTWLTISRSGFFAVLTNVWNPNSNFGASRGSIVPKVMNLSSLEDIESFLMTDHAQYSPFNLIYGNLERVMAFSTTTGKCGPLEKGTHTITSGNVNDRRFKSERLRDQFLGTKAAEPETDGEALLAILQDRTLPDSPEGRLADEFGDATAAKLGSIFVDLPTYGTVSSTILRISNSNRIWAVERTHTRQGDTATRQFSHDS